MDENKSQLKVTRTRKYYDEAYKCNAVELSLKEGRSIRAAAEVFSVSPAEFYRWWKKYGPVRAKSASSVRTLEQVEEENRRLRAELQRMCEREEVLKKSLGILSETPASGMPKLKR